MRNLYICTWNLRALKIFGTVQKIIRLEIYAFPKLYVSIRLIFPKTFRTPEVINFSNWTREVILPVERENLCEFLEILTFFRFMILFRSTKNINTYLIPWKLEYTLGNQFGMLNNYACLVYKLLLTAECNFYSMNKKSSFVFCCPWYISQILYIKYQKAMLPNLKVYKHFFISSMNTNSDKGEEVIFVPCENSVFFLLYKKKNLANKTNGYAHRHSNVKNTDMVNVSSIGY